MAPSSHIPRARMPRANVERLLHHVLHPEHRSLRRVERADDGEVLLEDCANGFYFGMRFGTDDWKPFMVDREIGLAIVVILGHCYTMISEDERMAVGNPQGEQLVAESWKLVPEVVEMLHVTPAGSRNVEIRLS